MTRVKPMTPAEWADSRRLEADYKNLPPGSAKLRVERLAADCKSKGYVDSKGDPDVLGYLNDYATENPIKRVDGKRFAFWAFQSPQDSSTPPVGSHFQAQACARTRNYLVLSATPAGGKLDSYRLDDREAIAELQDLYGISPRELEDAQARAWIGLSKSFAEASRKEVRVFAPDVHPESVLGKYELPALINNPHIGLENIKFVTKFPEHPHLPRSVDKFLSNDEVRAQVTMDHYDENGPSETVLKDSGLPLKTPPPHALAHKLDDIDLPHT